MAAMDEDAGLRLSILADMAGRAVAAGRVQAAPDALAEAFMVGLEWLERQPDRGSPALDGREAAAGRIGARARLDILRHRALVLTERNAALGGAVEALAEESLELHDRLWAAHEHSTRLKVRLGRRQTVMVRPDPPMEIGMGGGGRRRRESEARLLRGVAREDVWLPLAAEAGARAVVVAERLGWSAAGIGDGPLVALSHGLAVLEEASDGRGAATGQTAVEALAHRVFELAESVRILEIRENAFRIDNHGMRLRLGQLEREIVELEREVSERGEHDATNGSATPSGLEWLGRLWRKPGKDRREL
jgi:hypothetical protein